MAITATTGACHRSLPGRSALTFRNIHPAPAPFRPAVILSLRDEGLFFFEKKNQKAFNTLARNRQGARTGQPQTKPGGSTAMQSWRALAFGAACCLGTPSLAAPVFAIQTTP